MESDNHNPESELIAAQLKHTVDLLRYEIKTLQAKLEHQEQLYNHRLVQLETCKQDHENRLRQVQDGVTQFKVLAGLATGGGLLSLIALVKSLAGL